MAKNKLTFKQWVDTSTYPGTDKKINPKDKNNKAYFDNYVEKVEEASDAQADRIAAAHGQSSTTVEKEDSGEQPTYTEGLLSDIREASPFVTGTRSGGLMDYTGGTQSAKEYQDYVNTYPDLKRAWNEILTNPNSETARYWLPRMGVTDPSDITIDRFGMAHRAENDRLGRNTYIGDTDVRPGGSRWDEWLEGKDPATGQRDPTSDYWKDSILDPDDPNAGGITIIGGTKGIPGTTVPLGTTGLVNYAPGNEFLTTPYTRPALQDWSHLMPEEGLLRSQAQRAIVADQGANFQPWAQGGLIEYSPAGTATYVPRTYTPSVTPSVSTSPTSTGVVNQPWVGPGGVTDFAAWTAAQHELNYPGRTALANELGFGGLNYFTPEAAKWRASLVNGQIPQATPAGTREVYGQGAYDFSEPYVGLLPRPGIQ